MLTTTRFCPPVLIVLTMFVTLAGQNSDRKEEFDASIAESVFRYQIKKCAEDTSLKVFLLSLQGKDPSDELMKRFAEDSVTVKRKSALATSETNNEFVDKESGKPAALLSIDKLKFLKDGSAEVAGSCGYADWAARGYTYTLVREENRWIVKRADPTWVW